MKNFPSSFKTEEESPGFLLWRVSNIWQRKQREALKQVGLTHVQFVLLASIGWLEKDHSPLSQIELSSYAKTDPMMTSQVLRLLEKKGYVVRKRSSQDSRAYSLRLEKTGWAILQKALKIVEDVDERFFHSLGKERKAFLYHLQSLSSL